MLKNWLKIAFINYKKNWLSTIINLFGLTIGLTGFMLILMHWNDEESYEKWNPKKNQIYGIQSYYKKDKGYGSNISIPMAERAAKLIPEVKDFVLFNSSGMGFKMTTKNKTVYQQEGLATSENFFNFFPFKLISGSFKNALKSENAVALSTTSAKNVFGRTNVAGESLKFNGKNYIVTAVYELPKENSLIKPEFIILAYEQMKNDKEAWGSFNYGCFFMLKKDADLVAVQNKLVKEVFE
ncbi:ABC transporter permease [Chryseobacterium sp. CBo1]|uniref:ABC transporter permease n=1 Tax=Chryseobacterium sp. CBo1 TaxID=1869230 RepID=UPI000ABE1913|nr:ABC transporter permease [Chryseobacterium sp. CBo1]